jgi:hypothetical protein
VSKAKTATSKKPPAPKPMRQPKEGSKLAIIAGLLSRPNGCTAKEVMEACEWPAVSMPQQARALGIKLKVKKEGRVARYWPA